MNLEQIGPIIRNVRVKLEMSQTELADAVGCNAAHTISRLEQGKGGTIELLCDIVSFYRTKGIRAHMIFFEPFDEELLYKDPNQELVNKLKAISGMVDKL